MANRYCGLRRVVVAANGARLGAHGKRVRQSARTNTARNPGYREHAQALRSL